MFEKKIAWRSTAIATTAAGSQGTRATVSATSAPAASRRARRGAGSRGGAASATRISACSASPNADASTANVISRGPVQSCQWSSSGANAARHRGASRRAIRSTASSPAARRAIHTPRPQPKATTAPANSVATGILRAPAGCVLL